MNSASQANRRSHRLLATFKARRGEFPSMIFNFLCNSTRVLCYTITSMILGTLLMVFCEALCKSAHDGDLLSEMKKAATKSNFDLDGKGKLGEENEDDCDL